MRSGKARTWLAMVLSAALLPAAARAATIYDIQYSDAASSWQSSYYTQTVSEVTGGVVTYVGTPPGKATFRVVVQDPAFTEWAGVEIKVLDGSLNVSVGDKITLTNVVVDESRGGTYLLFDVSGAGSGFTVVSSGNSVAPTAVSPADLGAGDTSADPAKAEKYEGMLLKVLNVTVGDVDLGKAVDNYELTSSLGTCWGTDYFNQDRAASADYCVSTVTGAQFSAVVGILEQYSNSGTGYDYYQLMTRSEADFVPEPASAAMLLGLAGLILRRRGAAIRRA